jgi:hypothetical protein
MRFAAVSQSRPGAPVHVLGVGETMDDAFASARAWFETQFQRASSKDQAHLIALQDHLSVFAEDDLEAKSGLSLDGWLARMRAVGVVPPAVKAKPAAPAEVDDIWVDPPPLPTDGSGIGLETWVLAALVFVGVPLCEMWWGFKHIHIEGVTTTSALLRYGAAGLLLSLVDVAIWYVVLKLVFGLSMQTFIAISLGLRILGSLLLIGTGAIDRVEGIQNQLNSDLATIQAYDGTDPFGGGQVGGNFDIDDLIIPTYGPDWYYPDYGSP